MFFIEASSGMLPNLKVKVRFNHHVCKHPHPLGNVNPVNSLFESGVVCNDRLTVDLVQS